MTKLLTNNFKAHLGSQLVESITETANTAYYVFTADHVNRTTNTIPTPVDKIRETAIDSYRNMIFGKRITSSDMSLMIRNIPYQSNKIFAMYDDQDDTLFDKDFYCVVDETAYYHVYKCLDNNGNTASTVQPDFSHIVGANTIVYETSDGYRWKYMYSFTDTANNKFATTEYIPIVANTTVQDGAISGGLDVIKIDVDGKNYGNYTAGTFSSDDVRYSGNTLLYRISNTTLSQVNGYYTNTIIYLTTGTGAGEYRTVDNYFINPNGSFVVVNNAFSTPPLNGTTYEINPRVHIVGDGQQTVNAIARAVVNALSTNSIHKVEMLERGQEYSFFSANVIANAVVGVTSLSEIRPIYSPYYGHGKNPSEELGCKYVGTSVTFSNTEANTIPFNNSYEKIGLLKDPLFANVEIKFSGANGTYVADEKVYKYDPVRINTNATINTTAAAIVCATADFKNQLSSGDFVYMNSGNGTSHQLAVVNSVTNSSYVVLNNNGYFACTETIIYQANVSAIGYVSVVSNTTHLTLSNVVGQFTISDNFIGNNSGAVSTIDEVNRNGVLKTFGTYVQMYKYVGTVISGTFQNDEQVYQGANLSSSTANGYIHSIEYDGPTATMYVSNVVGTFTTSDNVLGETSAAQATLTTIYSPELVFGSGQVMYLENLDAVTRSNDQSELIKLIFEF
jgi:hypothetical protein